MTTLRNTFISQHAIILEYKAVISTLLYWKVVWHNLKNGIIIKLQKILF